MSVSYTHLYDKWHSLLASYEAPALDEALDKELCDFIAKRSEELS